MSSSGTSSMSLGEWLSEREWSETVVGLEKGVGLSTGRWCHGIKAAFKSSSRSTYVLFVATWTMYHVDTIFELFFCKKNTP